MAEVTGGYPLRLQEIAVRELERKGRLKEKSDDTDDTGALKRPRCGVVLKEPKV